MSTVRVYVNGHGVDAPADGTALDAVRMVDPAAAEELAAGQRTLADSRGLPAPADSAVYQGAIFRLVTVRARGAGTLPAGMGDEAGG